MIRLLTIPLASLHNICCRFISIGNVLCILCFCVFLLVSGATFWEANDTTRNCCDWICHFAINQILTNFNWFAMKKNIDFCSCLFGFLWKSETFISFLFNDAIIVLSSDNRQHCAITDMMSSWSLCPSFWWSLFLLHSFCIHKRHTNTNVILSNTQIQTNPSTIADILVALFHSLSHSTHTLYIHHCWYLYVFDAVFVFNAFSFAIHLPPFGMACGLGWLWFYRFFVYIRGSLSAKKTLTRSRVRDTLACVCVGARQEKLWKRCDDVCIHNTNPHTHTNNLLLFFLSLVV